MAKVSPTMAARPGITGAKNPAAQQQAAKPAPVAGAKQPAQPGAKQPAQPGAKPVEKLTPKPADVQTGPQNGDTAAAPKKRGRKAGSGEGRVKRIPYPLPTTGEGDEMTVEQLTEIPADYDPKIHLPLKRKWFADESLWFEMRAQAFDRQAKRMRRLGEESRKLGTVKDRTKAKKLIRLQARMQELQASLEADGVDIEELLRGLDGGNDDAQEGAPDEGQDTSEELQEQIEE